MNHDARRRRLRAILCAVAGSAVLAGSVGTHAATAAPSTAKKCSDTTQLATNALCPIVQDAWRTH